MVRLKSPDPLAAPAIVLRFLATEYDIRAMISGIRIVRQLSQQSALKSFVSEEIQPGLKVDADADMESFVRRLGYANLHPVGSCRMGGDKEAVLNSRLRVNGVGKLRVAEFFRDANHHRRQHECANNNDWGKGVGYDFGRRQSRLNSLRPYIV